MENGGAARGDKTQGKDIAGGEGNVYKGEGGGGGDRGKYQKYQCREEEAGWGSKE